LAGFIFRKKRLATIIFPPYAYREGKNKLNLIAPALSLDIEPTLADIKKALSDIRTVERDVFVMLKRTKMTFVQTTYSNGSYALECQFESSDNRFRAKRIFTYDEITQAFELYYKADIAWKQGIKFEKINTSDSLIFKLGLFAGNILIGIKKLFTHA
jgi:hypothetical protein